jgi:hypothetical protein
MSRKSIESLWRARFGPWQGAIVMVPSLNESKCRSRINDKRISIARSGTFGDMKTWILQWTEALQHLEGVEVSFSWQQTLRTAARNPF